jgi:hypothetical protein
LVLAQHPPSCRCTYDQASSSPRLLLLLLLLPPGSDDIEFKRTGGKVTVTDPQGNVANVVGKPVHPDENKTIIPIDRVLMGGEI